MSAARRQITQPQVLLRKAQGETSGFLWSTSWGSGRGTRTVVHLHYLENVILNRNALALLSGSSLGR